MVIHEPWTTQKLHLYSFLSIFLLSNFSFLFLRVIHKGQHGCFIMWVTSAHLVHPSALQITLVLGIAKKRSSLSPFSYPLRRSSCRPSINMSIISPVIIKKVKSFSIKSSACVGRHGMGIVCFGRRQYWMEISFMLCPQHIRGSFPRICIEIK